MNQEKPISPGAIETAHLEIGRVEVEPPTTRAEDTDYRCSVETYTFSMPSAPVPRWVRDMVARRQRSVDAAEPSLPSQ